MTFEFARSIGDDYSEYVDDELGYNYHASEVISATEANRHRRICLLDSEALDELEAELGELSDLEHWALARRRLQDNPDAYFDHVQAIVDGELAHPALHYPEIYVDIARQHASNDDLARANQVIDDIEEQWPELAEALPMLRAQLKLRAGDVDAADRAFEESMAELDEDVDLLIETAQDFHKYDAPQVARKWLQKARQAAQKLDDKASMVDIELLEQSLPAPTDDADGDVTGDEVSVDADRSSVDDSPSA